MRYETIGLTLLRQEYSMLHAQAQNKASELKQLEHSYHWTIMEANKSRTTLNLEHAHMLDHSLAWIKEKGQKVFMDLQHHQNLVKAKVDELRCKDAQVKVLENILQAEKKEYVSSLENQTYLEIVETSTSAKFAHSQRKNHEK